MKNVSALILSLLLACSTHASPKKFRIVIDPGHGGMDSGATQGDLKESHIVLSIAERLKEKLVAKVQFDVHMTRSSDETVALESRSRLAEKLQPDLFLSLHVNSSLTPSAQGVEFYILGQISEDEESMFLAAQENQSASSIKASDEDKPKNRSDLHGIVLDLKRTVNTRQSLKLAKVIKKFWSQNIHPGHGKIRQAPFHVLAHVAAPSLLVELGYVSHAKEGPWLAKAESQETIARVLASAIESHFGPSLKALE